MADRGLRPLCEPHGDRQRTLFELLGRDAQRHQPDPLRLGAVASPHRSGHTITAWSPAATPSFVWPSTIRASGVAIETSASSPTARPAPTAGPVIADTIGFGQSMTL